MTDKPRTGPEKGWLETLPRHRLMAEMSTWSADLGRLVEDLQRVDAFTDMFHIDVADGHFAPAMLFFPDLVTAARRVTRKPLHIHLMVADTVLLSQIDQFAEAGADLISVHAENTNAALAVGHIRSLGLEAGLVLQLHSPVAAAAPFLESISMLTLLGTRIGVKGQGLDEQAGTRLREAKTLTQSRSSRHRIILAADGGIRENIVPQLRASGAETIVMGSLAFGAADLAARMAWVHEMPDPT